MGMRNTGRRHQRFHRAKKQNPPRGYDKKLAAIGILCRVRDKHGNWITVRL